MEIDKNTVFLLTSADGSKKAFGTGFAVAHKDGQLYLLTCAHVVDDLASRVLVNGDEAEIVKAGSRDTIDLALLRIAYDKHEVPSLLNCTTNGEPEKEFHIRGYNLFIGARETHSVQEIRGCLGRDLGLTFNKGKSHIEAWELKIDDNQLSKLQPGNSGSPLCDEGGRLIAVVSHEWGGGKFGYAIGISNLKTIYPEIKQLIPSFANFDNENLDAATRINQAMRQLADPDRLSEIYSVFPVIGLELERMRKEGIRDADEEIFNEINSFVEGTLTAKAFIDFFAKLENRRKTATGPDYKRFMEQLNKGQVILCLGQELSPLLGSSIPGTAELISRLAVQEKFSGPLSEICEQKEIAPDCCRADLVNELHSLFRSAEQSPSLPLHELLAGLRKPFIIISTAYDDLLEQSLQGRRNFVVICPNMEGKECLLRYSDGREIICTPEEISQHKPLENGYAVIYRLRGGIVGSREHLLLSERDYFQFNRLMAKQFPDYIGSRLKSTLCSLWFLGHHPQSWEERLLIRFLKDFQDERASSFAVQETLSPFARSFWQQPKVRARVFELPLTEFVEQLVKEAAA